MLENIDQVNFTKIEHLCSYKKIKSMKMQATEWEWIFSMHTCYNGFIFSIF